jgi:hypothetical protein
VLERLARRPLGGAPVRMSRIVESRERLSRLCSELGGLLLRRRNLISKGVRRVRAAVVLGVRVVRVVAVGARVRVPVAVGRATCARSLLVDMAEGAELEAQQTERGERGASGEPAHGAEG